MSMKTITSKAAAIGSVSVILAACASTPAPNDNLERARMEYQQLRQSPGASQLAGVQLEQADKAFERADGAWRNDEDKPIVDHLATLAERRAQIAQAVLDRRQAEQQVEQASAARNAVLLESRELQVQQAQAGQATAQRQNDQLRTQVERSEDKVTQLNEQMREMSAQQTDRGMVVTLDGVLFATGSSDLKSGADRKIDRLAEILRDSPDRQLLVEGFTDSTGSSQLNRQLSQERADAVMFELIRKGVARDRIRSRGLGEEYPVASNDTDEGRQQNRRVELIVSNAGEAVSERGRSAQRN